MELRSKMRAVAIVLAAVAVVGGCAGDDDDAQASSNGEVPAGSETAVIDHEGDPWEPLVIHGDEAEGFATYEEMLEEADAVLVGRFKEFELGREVRGGAPEDVARYLNGAFEVSEVISGESDADEITIEFTYGGGSGEILRQDLAQLTDQATEGKAVVFLRAKTGEGEAGLLRLVNSYGLVVATAEAPVAAPLAEVIPGGGYPEDHPGSVSDRWTSIDDFVAHLRTLP